MNDMEPLIYNRSSRIGVEYEAWTKRGRLVALIRVTRAGRSSCTSYTRWWAEDAKGNKLVASEQTLRALKASIAEHRAEATKVKRAWDDAWTPTEV